MKNLQRGEHTAALCTTAPGHQDPRVNEGLRETRTHLLHPSVAPLWVMTFVRSGWAPAPNPDPNPGDKVAPVQPSLAIIPVETHKFSQRSAPN